jgi:hypothetical protein
MELNRCDDKLHSQVIVIGQGVDFFNKTSLASFKTASRVVFL